MFSDPFLISPCSPILGISKAPEPFGPSACKFSFYFLESSSGSGCSNCTTRTF